MARKIIFDNLKLQRDFLFTIDNFMEENPEKGFTSRADFIRHCVRKELGKQK